MRLKYFFSFLFFFNFNLNKEEIGFHNRKAKVCVSKVLAIEENIWSPMYGLKGIITMNPAVSLLVSARRHIDLSFLCDGVGVIDASVEMKVNHHGCTVETLALPLELKTGKQSDFTNSSYRAQLTLYTLLMSDRYGTPN